MRTFKTRKGLALAEVLIGIVILSGVLVSMSQFLAGAMLATTRARDMSRDILDSYTQTRWLAFRADLSETITMSGDKQVKVVKGDEADDIEIALTGRDAIKLIAYNVGDKVALRIYRLADDGDDD